MKAYQLCWQTFKHILRGRGGEEVTVAVHIGLYPDWDELRRDEMASAEQGVEFTWADTYCTVQGGYVPARVMYGPKKNVPLP